MLQQLNSFLLSQTHQACLSHIKELVGGSVRELMMIINVNTYHTREVHHGIQGSSSKDTGSSSNSSSSSSSSSSMMMMGLLPHHYELFMKEEMQRLYRNDLTIGETFIDTYFTSFITHTLPALCRLYPVHNRVLKLSIYFMKRHFQQQKIPLISYFRSYLDKKLNELCELSYKQYKKLSGDSNNNNNNTIIITNRNDPSVCKTRPSNEDDERDDRSINQCNRDDDHVTAFDQPYILHEMHKVSNNNIRYINDDNMMMIIDKVRAIFATFRFQLIVSIDEQRLIRSKYCDDTHDHLNFFNGDVRYVEGTHNTGSEYSNDNNDGNRSNDTVILNVDANADQFIEKSCQYHLPIHQHALPHPISDSISSRRDSSSNMILFRNHLSKLFKALLELTILLCSYRHSHQYMHAIDTIAKRHRDHHHHDHQSHRSKKGDDDDSHAKASNDIDDRSVTLNRSREIVRKYHYALLNLTNLLFCTFRSISDQLKSSPLLPTSNTLSSSSASPPSSSSSSSSSSRSTPLSSSSLSSSYQEFSGKVIIDIAKCCSLLLPYLLYTDSILEYNHLIHTSSTPINSDIISTDSSTTAETDSSINAETESINISHDIITTSQPSDVLILLLHTQMMTIDSLVKLLTAVLRPKTSAYYESCKRLIGIDDGGMMLHHRVLVLVERVLYYYREKLEMNIFDLLTDDKGGRGQSKNSCDDDRDNRDDDGDDDRNGDNRGGSGNPKSKYHDSSRCLWYHDPNVQRIIRTKLSEGFSTFIITSFTGYKPI